jgi:hypothetical protein
MKGMNIKIITLLIFISLGAITLIPGVMDELIFNYHKITKRFVNGDSIILGARCYRVPENWFIDRVDSIEKRKVYDLTTRAKDKYISTSITHEMGVVLPADERLIKAKESTFNIYELAALQEASRFRYWSYIFKYELIIMGESIDSVKSISRSIETTDCK